jgi:replicative DNA helicase
MEALATEAGKAFLTQGILGSLVLILLGAVVFLYREGRGSDQKRFEELQKIIDAREQVAKALNMNSLALEANNRAMDARTRATEEMAKEIETLRREIENAERQGGFNDERVRGKLDEILKRLDAVLTRGLT